MKLSQLPGPRMVRGHKDLSNGILQGQLRHIEQRIRLRRLIIVERLLRRCGEWKQRGSRYAQASLPIDFRANGLYALAIMDDGRLGVMNTLMKQNLKAVPLPPTVHLPVKVEDFEMSDNWSEKKAHIVLIDDVKWPGVALSSLCPYPVLVDTVFLWRRLRR